MTVLVGILSAAVALRIVVLIWECTREGTREGARDAREDKDR